LLHGRSIDVYATEPVDGQPEEFKQPWPLQVSPLKYDINGEVVEPIRLLLYRDHYMAIRSDDWRTDGSSSFQRLFSSQDRRKTICPRCIQSFGHNYNIDSHRAECEGYDARLTIMSRANEFTQFKMISSLVASPIFLYCETKHVRV
jgi:hypothetical protein